MHECFATVRERRVVARKTTEAIGGGFDDPPRRVRESAKRTAAAGGGLTMPRRGSDVLRWKTHALSGLGHSLRAFWPATLLSPLGVAVTDRAA